MNVLTFLYTEILWRPLFNGLVWFYTVLPIRDLGVAIVLLTIAIRLLLTPLLLKASRAQRNLARIQPEIKKIQDRFKDDRGVQARELMEFYKKEGVNPFSGCLVMLFQLPILIALYQVFYHGFEPEQLKYLYAFIENPETLNPLSFGILDLARGNVWLGIFAALTQFYQTKLISPPAPNSSGGQGDFGKMLQWQTTYIFPALILVWSITLPSALTLYWTVLNILGILQEIVVRNYGSRNN